VSLFVWCFGCCYLFVDDRYVFYLLYVVIEEGILLLFFVDFVEVDGLDLC